MARTMNASVGYERASSRVSQFVDGLIEGYVNYRLYRRTLNEMSALSNRDLADLGLHRSMLKRVAWQAAYERS